MDVVGDNVLTNIEIDFVTATLGGEVEVPVVDTSNSSGLGKSKLKILQERSMELISFRGKGMPRLRETVLAMCVQVFVPVPRKVSRNKGICLKNSGNPPSVTCFSLSFVQ
jgi:DnaJ-class molecular chaperone